ncbi:hypothetical protein QK289_13140 [Exiguobacterium antarcticum]|uniref:Uncharacterized protein n=1 Tax=Exiguobacterium antarcticum TaxID=132920 RepID=A0ABT6R4S7_9BACL|nr:hypothetical protein [Exiguobacterium antarcticum]MDI3235955.1 hypothetical protein [Exiguobacterium antarcticum]
MDNHSENLLSFQKSFNRILKEDYGTTRDFKLANLMTEMEKVLQIPILRNEQWELKHQEEISLYRQVSDARNLK